MPTAATTDTRERRAEEQPRREFHSDPQHRHDRPTVSAQASRGSTEWCPLSERSFFRETQARKGLSRHHDDVTAPPPPSVSNNGSLFVQNVFSFKVI